MKEPMEGISMGEERGKRREGGGWATGWGGRGDGVVMMCDGVGGGFLGLLGWEGGGEEGVDGCGEGWDGWDCLGAYVRW